MRPSDLSFLRIPSSPTLSPDGRLVAVAVTRIDLDDDAYRGELWMVGTDGSPPARRFTSGYRDFLPRFSPDGRWLAFLRVAAKGDKPQLHVMPVDGGEPARLAEHPLGVEGFSWSPDSGRIAYTARVPEPGRYGTDEKITPDAEPPRHITTLRYRFDNLGFILDRRPHVFVIDVASALDGGAEPVQLTRGDFDHGSPTWSPDGRHVAFVSARHETRDTDLASDLFVVPAGGGDAVQVTRTVGDVARPAYSPDGTTIYFTSDGYPAAEAAGRNTGVWAVPADGSAPQRRLTDPEPWDVDNFQISGGLPLRTVDGGVVTVVLERGGIGLHRFPVGGGEPVRLIGGRRQVLDYDVAGGVVAAVVATGTSAGEVVACGTDGSGERVLTDFGALLARSTSLRPLEDLTATAPDGAAVSGWLVKPAGNGPFPVLLSIHGGPFTQYGHVLFDEAQVYAGAGYAVVLGNPRGSAGYGEAHGRSIVGDMGNLDAKDLLALLDAALADPDLDPSRVGVMGGSYGGYMTTWLTGHEPDRFVAAISERALNAPDSFEGSSDIGDFFNDAYFGTDPERVRAQSPLAHADGIRCPMLIIHSEHDWRCPVEQAQRLFVHLKRRGVPAELLLFPGEGHELSRSGLPSHRIARFEAILEWWQRHLKPAG